MKNIPLLHSKFIYLNLTEYLVSHSVCLTFGICWPHAVPFRHAAAVGAHGVGAVVGRGHGRPPLAEEDPWRHRLGHSRRLDCSSVELVVCQAAVLGVQIVLWWATVLRDFTGLLYHYCLLFGAFLLLLGFLLLLLLTHHLFFTWYFKKFLKLLRKKVNWQTWWESLAAAAARPVSMEATRAPSLAGRSCRGTEGPTRAVMIHIKAQNT